MNVDNKVYEVSKLIYENKNNSINETDFGGSNIVKFAEYQELALRTRNKDLTKNEAYCNYSMGLNGEAGEVVDLLKKVVFHGHEMEPLELAKELGDCLWYLTNLSNSAGFSLEEIATMNIVKLMKRYPNGFDQQASINRVE
jgi:NTP pyrophosphatase (non-canonical NTP hydrolase)